MHQKRILALCRYSATVKNAMTFKSAPDTTGIDPNHQYAVCDTKTNTILVSAETIDDLRTALFQQCQLMFSSPGIIVDAINQPPLRPENPLNV